MNAPERIQVETAYAFRTVPCHECDGTRHCDQCNGFGRVDASCAECQCITTINDDGLCRRCADACSLPIAEYHEKYGFCGLTADKLADPMRRRA